MPPLPEVCLIYSPDTIRLSTQIPLCDLSIYSIFSILFVFYHIFPCLLLHLPYLPNTTCLSDVFRRYLPSILPNCRILYVYLPPILYV